MSDKSIIAIDPGGTTGIAIRLPTRNIITCTASTPEEVYDILCKGVFSHVVIENFQAQLIGKWGLHTVRIVGGVYALAYQRGIEYVLHMPQDRYPFQKIAKEFLRGRKTVIHEQDALAHLFRFEYDTEKTST